MKVNNDNFKSELESQYNILIKAEKKEQQKRTLIITTILSITLLMTLLGTVFAYNSYQNSIIINASKTKEVNNYYETLSVTYNNTSLLELNNITAGYILLNPKVINVTNEGDKEIVYDIKLTGIKTTLLSNSNLVYTITKGTETSIARELPLKSASIITDAKISPNETISYIMNVYYTGNTDIDNVNNYQAKIEVLQKNNQVDLLE